MISNNLELKPTFNTEIEAKIDSLGKITSNVKEVREYAIKLKEFYSNLVFTEETISVAKEEKARLNKFKNSVSDYRKEIKKEFNRPLDEFENISKEAEELLKETYEKINKQVKKYEEAKKIEKENEIKDFFEEYKKSLNIEFVNFEDAKIDITLSSSNKSLKEQVKQFLEKIKNEVETINLQEYKEEILIEYKQTLNLSKSISNVLNRKEMLKREVEIRKKQEIERQKIQENLDNFKTEVKSEILDTPEIEVLKKQDENIELLRVVFIAEGTLEQIKVLKKFCKDNEIKLFSK